MSKDKSVKKRQKREERKKHMKGKDSFHKDFSEEEKSAGKLHIYVLGGLTTLLALFIIYSYSK